MLSVVFSFQFSDYTSKLSKLEVEAPHLWMRRRPLAPEPAGNLEQNVQPLLQLQKWDFRIQQHILQPSNTNTPVSFDTVCSISVVKLFF